MSKHETSNQFNNGLMMDLNPLQTPNTVLTDCLNGTFITYNGNEYVLQNDMGNFKLPNCELKENYMPIGTASYGGILYIASYNPIDKKFELGSFPSPLQVTELDNPKDCDRKLNQSIIDDARGKNSTVSYSECLKFEQTLLFKDPNNSDLKLCPGDEYKLEVKDEESKYKLEKLNYYILDDNGASHEIEPKTGIKTHVDFDVPGYLYIKKTLATPSECKSYIENIWQNGNSVVFTINTTLIIDDDYLCEKIDDVKDLLCLQLTNNINEYGKYIISKNKYEDEYADDGYFTKYIAADVVEVRSYLDDKKQILYNYKIPIEYNNDNELVSGYPVEYYSVNTQIEILPYCVENDVSVKFDNIKYSIEKIITGAAVYEADAARNVFTWQKDDSDKSWNITFDVINSNSVKQINITLSTPGDNIPFKTATLPVANSCNINISNERDDQIIIVKIQLILQDDSNVKIGRIAFLDTSGVMEFISDIRMDNTYKLQDVFDKYCNTHIENHQVTVKLGDKIGDSYFEKGSPFKRDVDENSIWLENQYDKNTVRYYSDYKYNFECVYNDDSIWSKVTTTNSLSEKDCVSVYKTYNVSESETFSLDKPYAYTSGELTNVKFERTELGWELLNSESDAPANIRRYSGNQPEYDFLHIYPGNLSWFEYIQFKNFILHTGSKPFLFKNIYAYKKYASGSDFGIQNIGHLTTKGIVQLPGFHLSCIENGSPTIVLTQNSNVENNLYYFKDGSNVSKKWKNRFICTLTENKNETIESYVDYEITFKENSKDQTIAFLFNNDIYKLPKEWNFENVDNMATINSVVLKARCKVDITPEFDEVNWNDIYERVVINWKNNKRFYEKMTDLCTEYGNDRFPATCLISDIDLGLLPACLYTEDVSYNPRIVFNHSLANELSAGFTDFPLALYRISYGEYKNWIPINAVKYGF